MFTGAWLARGLGPWCSPLGDRDAWAVPQVWGGGPVPCEVRGRAFVIAVVGPAVLHVGLGPEAGLLSWYAGASDLALLAYRARSFLEDFFFLRR